MLPICNAFIPPSEEKKKEERNEDATCFGTHVTLESANAATIHLANKQDQAGSLGSRERRQSSGKVCTQETRTGTGCVGKELWTSLRASSALPTLPAVWP